MRLALLSSAIAVASVPVLSKSINTNKLPKSEVIPELKLNTVFNNCSEHHKDFLMTTLDEVLNLFAVAEHAARLELDYKATSFEFMNRTVTLTSNITWRLLKRWFGHDVDSREEEDIPRIRAVADMYGELAKAMSTPDASTFHFDCKPEFLECARENGTTDVLVNWMTTNTSKEGDLWWKDLSVKPCGPFWHRRSLAKALHHRDVFDEDVKPAPYSLLAEITRTMVAQRIGFLLDTFGQYVEDTGPFGHWRRDDDDPKTVDIFSFAKGWGNAISLAIISSTGAVINYDNWPGYAMDIAEAAFKGPDHLPWPLFEVDYNEEDGTFSKDYTHD